MLAICFVTAMAACGSEDHQEPRAHSHSSGVTTDKTTIDEALKFGGIVLPTSAQVLGVQHDKGIDQRYRLALQLNSDALAALLSGSRFTTPLEPDAGPFKQPVEGLDLAETTAIVSATDSLAPEGERRSTVFREIAVDQSNSLKPIVHLWLFTT